MLKQKKQWILKNKELLSGDFLIAYLLRDRGVPDKSEECFFSPNFERDLHDPYLFRDMKKAVERVLIAAEKNEKILIYGDYDVDGVTSSTMLYKLLSALGLKAEVYLPHRENEGYGMNKDVVKQFSEKGFSLLISSDCGISNFDEIDLANKSGMDVIIFDHHLPPEKIPAACAIINSKLSEETYPFKELSSGGVVFKFIQAFFKNEKAKKFAQSKGLFEGWEKWLLDLAAISTICDSMPLVGENRVLVKYGLRVLSKTRNPGLRRLMEIARVNPAAVDAEKVGFCIGPRINAAGRMEHANLAFSLLNTESDAEAVELSAQLNQANINRQKLVEQIMNQARHQLAENGGNFACVAYGADWPAGIVGLVAGKLKDEFYLPTFIIGSNGEKLTGSGRSIDELNIMEVMQKAAEGGLLAKFGGHKMACGFSLINESAVDEFKKQINQIAQEFIGELELSPKLSIDAHLPLEHISEPLVGELAQFAPFGSGNSKPKFFAKNLEVVSVEPVGLTKKHLRSYFRDSQGKVWKVMGFGWNSNGHLPFEANSRLDIVYELSENEWNGNKEIQIELVDARIVGV